MLYLIKQIFKKQELFEESFLYWSEKAFYIFIFCVIISVVKSILLLLL